MGSDARRRARRWPGTVRRRADACASERACYPFFRVERLPRDTRLRPRGRAGPARSGLRPARALSAPPRDRTRRDGRRLSRHRPRPAARGRDQGADRRRVLSRGSRAPAPRGARRGLAEPSAHRRRARRRRGSRAFPSSSWSWSPGRASPARRPTDFEDIVAIAVAICAALEHAHAHGIVHRDLKPENVLLAGEGRHRSVKLADLGLAVPTSGVRLTQEGAIVGTVSFMAPEQAMGQPVDGRADLYSLGRRPLRAGDRTSSLHRGPSPRRRVAARQRARGPAARRAPRRPARARGGDPAPAREGSRAALRDRGRDGRGAARGARPRGRKQGRAKRHRVRPSRCSTRSRAAGSWGAPKSSPKRASSGAARARGAATVSC